MRARLIVADQSSQEFDHMRRSYNALLLILEDLGARLAAEVTTAPSAADLEILAVFQSISDGIRDGVDSDPDSELGTHVPTSLPIEGLRPTPRHPRRARGNTVVVLATEGQTAL